MREVPPHLLRALGHYHEERDLWRFVTQLELYGVAVEVKRVQLGSPAVPGFGEQILLYRTPDSRHASLRGSPDKGDPNAG